MEDVAAAGFQHSRAPASRFAQIPLNICRHIYKPRFHWLFLRLPESRLTAACGFARLQPVLDGTGNLGIPRRPSVQRGGIEIRTVGPNQRVHLGVQSDLFKQAQVAQRPVKLASKDGAEINFPAQAVVKSDLQGERPDNGKRLHSAKAMCHIVIIAAAQWAWADVLAATNARLPTIRPRAFQPKLPPVAAAEVEATPTSIRPDASRKLPPPLDNRRGNAADDAEQTARHTCG